MNRMSTILRVRFLASCLSAAAVFLPLPAAAQHPEAGTVIFDFLGLAYDARSVAMAGASAALPNDLYGMFTNPASLGFLASRQALAGYRQVWGGIFGVPAAYAWQAPGMGVFAAGLCGLTSGTINTTDVGPSGEYVYTGSPARADNYAGAVSWAKKIGEGCGAGVTVKGVYSYLKGEGQYWSADGCAVDAGLQYRFMNSRLIYGFAARNVGFLRSGFVPGDSYPLPGEFAAGVSYVPKELSSMRLAFDLSKRRGDYLAFAPAVELELVRNQFVARAGYNLSSQDVQKFGDMLSGGSTSGYVKTNRTTLCLGAGLLATITRRRMAMDAAVEFSDLPVMPAFVLSMLASF